jgi:Bacterial toxin homologue of phage lysozyme, C-term
VVTKKKTPELTEEQKKEAAEKAAVKAEAARLAREEQVKSDQTWLDDTSAEMSDKDKEELFQQISKNCAGTTRTDGRIVIKCPVPKKLQYCVNNDPFECAHGKVPGMKGCQLSKAASDSLREKDETCIDGGFVSKAEGGAYMSPYVPWGPISGASKDGKPVLTTRNSSGVTIGTGVDLGAISDSDAYLKRLEKAGVSKETRDQLQPFLGKKKADACQALREAKTKGALVFPEKDVELIDLDAMKTRIPDLKSQFKKARENMLKSLNQKIAAEKKANTLDQAKIDAFELEKEQVKEFKDLTCAQQTILFSTLYHEGNINKPHSKGMVESMLGGDADEIRESVLAKSKNAQKLIASRGALELKYLD